MKNILVTGGLGYVGSHVVIKLLTRGYNPIIIDNLSNSSLKIILAIKKITGIEVNFILGDINDKLLLESVFKNTTIDAVMHFAGFKAVGESTIKGLEYYQNNVSGSINLLQVMQKYQVKTIVFSSSATVYKQSAISPITEDAELWATNPYGFTKLMTEQILKDLHFSDPQWNIAILRYFNPIGAHSSHLIGEKPNGIPNNLIPYLTQVIAGTLPCLNIFGNDYETIDGTGVRDYIHIEDLALAHLQALEYFNHSQGIIIVNLGTGIGYSVLQVIAAFEQVSAKKVNYKFVPRRDGDVAICFANPTKAYQLLSWRSVNNLEQMCLDSWLWQQNSL